MAPHDKTYFADPCDESRVWPVFKAAVAAPKEDLLFLREYRSPRLRMSLENRDSAIWSHHHRRNQVLYALA